MDHRAARRRIQEILDDPTSRMLYRGHAEDRGDERAVTTPELHHVLRSGAVVGAPMWCEKFKNWNCTVEGPDRDGRYIRVAVGVWTDRSQLYIITVVRIR